MTRIDEATARRLLGKTPRKYTQRGAGSGHRGSDIEEKLAQHMKWAGLPPFEREWQWHPTRAWRFDFAWPDLKLAIEVEGGIWSKGRHTRGAGFIRDAEKYNEAELAGWTILRVVEQWISDGTALALVERAVKLKG